jgi:hypothetical protein
VPDGFRFPREDEDEDGDGAAVLGGGGGSSSIPSLPELPALPASVLQNESLVAAQFVARADFDWERVARVFFRGTRTAEECRIRWLGKVRAAA